MPRRVGVAGYSYEHIEGWGEFPVVDRENDRVQVFTATGECVTEWDDVPGGNDAVIDESNIMHIATGPGAIILVKIYPMDADYAPSEREIVVPKRHTKMVLEWE